jgi:hypothetical protein
MCGQCMHSMRQLNMPAPPRTAKTIRACNAGCPHVSCSVLPRTCSTGLATPPVPGNQDAHQHRACDNMHHAGQINSNVSCHCIMTSLAACIIK